MYIFTQQDLDEVFVKTADKSTHDILRYLQLTVYPSSTVVFEKDIFYVYNSLQERVNLKERLFHHGIHLCESSDGGDKIYFIKCGGDIYKILASTYHRRVE